jgi:hypothetical protein
MNGKIETTMEPPQIMWSWSCIHVEIIPLHPYVNVANGDPSIFYIVSVFARLA